MSIVCPHCQQAMKMNQPKPGRYTPQCPKCSQRLLIVVSDNPATPPNVVLVKEKSAAEPAQAAEPARTAAPAAQPRSAAVTTDFSPERPRSRSSPAVTEAPDAARGLAATTAPTNAPAIAPTGPPPARSADDTTGFSAPDERQPQGELSGKLGGYDLIKQLGRGGMGAVYLARQLSLDRNVAVKVMRSDWARDPVFVARFTREAFAAAQLVHHHVVQIYDIGVEKQNNYFSMELVDGKSLADLLEQQGKLDAQVAVGYILQAARGLAFAHQQGMVHRDIKPDNLLINSHGIVKVADLGIVKVPGASGNGAAGGRASSPGTSSASASSAVTMAGVAMGTPHFMAPEQARDSASVDARADIYSLGCTLYMLLTGQPPFQGKTAIEVITKHASEPVIPPDVVVKRVPKNLSEIIVKMVAKQPSDRFANMEEVVKSLEAFLGVESGKPFSPREDHAAALEEAAAGFYRPPIGRLRGKLAAGWFGLLGVATLLMAFFSPSLAIGTLGLMVMTPLAHLVMRGVAQKTFLFAKTRELVFTSGVGGWIKGAVAVLAVLVVLFALGWLWIWLAAAVLAVLLALGYYVAVDRSLAAARRAPIEKAEQLLKTLRLNGLEENSLRQFVCRYSGVQWEEFYEDLFGYEAKLEARARWGLVDRGTARPKFAAWRDPVVRWIDARVQSRKEARERRHLAAMEEMGLRAEGVDPADARKQAEAKTAVLMAKVKKSPRKKAAADDAPGRPRWLRAVESLVGPQVRFFGGAALLACSLLWAHQNHLIRSEELKSAADSALQQAQEGRLDESQVQASKELAGSWIQRARAAADKPLSIPFVPTAITVLASHLCAAGAGLLLLVSSFQESRKFVFATTIAAIALFGAHWLGLP